MSEKRTGRPPKYTEAQVQEGIDLVEANGQTPTGDTVKEAMCTHLKVSGGINALSLDKEVQRLIEERERARRERLIAVLPSATKAAAKAISAQLEAAILDHMAEEYEGLRTAAGKRTAELEEDLNTQRSQIRGLLSNLDEKEVALADLEAAKEDLRQKLLAAEGKIAKLKARVSSLEEKHDLRAEMIELMKETMKTNTG
jgi:chromosome segregation ATPase